MFREMRRKLQALDQAECKRILREGKTGVLALSGDGGYPYPVPLNYVYDGEYIYFHCAKTGHKIDSVNRCDKAGFCVVDKDEVMPEKFATAYKSVIAFGRICLVKEEEEMRRATYLLSKKIQPRGIGRKHKPRNSRLLPRPRRDENAPGTYDGEKE